MITPNPNHRRRQPKLSPRELATVLGALRMYQEAGADLNHPSDAIDDVLTNGGQHTSLTSKEVDALCERLNQ